MEQCNGCKKEDFDNAFYSIGEKWKKNKEFYGRFIYSCEKCYAKELEKFTSEMDKKGTLIVRPPIV